MKQSGGAEFPWRSHKRWKRPERTKFVMKLFSQLKSFLHCLFRREELDEDLDDELHSHVELLTDQKLKAGITFEAARRATTIELGGVEQVKEQVRVARAGAGLETLLQDIRFGLRMLRKSPGFTAVAVLTLGLGIGANTAIFSVVQAVLLAPLPYHEPDRIMTVWLNNFALKSWTYLSYPDFLDWRRSASSFERMAAFRSGSYDLTSPGRPGHLDGMDVSAGFFSTLGIRLACGREFAPNEDALGGAPVAVISAKLWRDRFGRSTTALGQTLTLDGLDYRIVGVLPAGFQFAAEGDVFVPIGQRNPGDLTDRTVHNIGSIGRLKTGITMAQAQAEMNTIQDSIDRLYPDFDKGLGTEVMPLKEFLVGNVRGTVLLLLGAVSLVLLIACANFANLVLARSATRRREFAIRAALGAKRVRILQQLITESVLLSLAGGDLGLVLAQWGTKPLLAAVPVNLPRIENVRASAPVLFFAFALSIAVGVLFGLAPALNSSRIDLQTSLKAGERGATSSHRYAQNSLVVVQMALTLVLLVGAGLLFRTIEHLWQVNPGFNPQHVITFRVGLSASATKTSSSVRIAYQQLIDRIRQIPGVLGAEVTTLVPMGHQLNDVSFWVGSQRPASVAEAPRTLSFITGPSYLQVMGIPLLRGRFITREDTVNSPLVVVIDEVMARTYFPNSDPVGQTITFAQVRLPYQIIGIAGHVQHLQLGSSSPFIQNQAYVSFYQIFDRWMRSIDTWTNIVVRTRPDTKAVVPAIEAAVYGPATDQVVYDVQTLPQLLSDSMSPQRFPMIVLAAFAVLALVLASVGIYGVISYSVTQSVREIGIRMALGAERPDVFRMVIGQGLRLALIGLAIGTAATLILTRLLSSFSHLLYGVGTHDPLTFSVVSLVFVAVALLACWIPARRAMRLDPMVALRYE
jgi:predicted permease